MWRRAIPVPCEPSGRGISYVNCLQLWERFRQQKWFVVGDV
eukprot:UN14800